MPAKLTLLTEALKAAKEVAQALKDTEDSGTCNFDQPILYGVREAILKEAAEAAGVDYYKTKRYGRVCYLLGSIMEGQANRRTRMAEAAYKTLKAAGFEVSMYYAID